MASNIFGERSLVRRQPAWHGLGQVMPEDEKINALDAMAKADILFNIETMPMFTKLPDGTEVQTDSFAVVREPVGDDDQHRVLATVGKEWTPIQAKDLGTMLNPISEKFPVETAGALGKGEKIFMTLDAGNSTIANEDHQLYWLVTDHRDGGGALTIAFTPVRVVCQNTLVTGMKNAKVSVNLKHTSNIKTDAQFYLDIFTKMKKVQETVVTAMNSLTTVTLVEKQVNAIIDTAYPKASQPNRLRLANGFTSDDLPKAVWNKILKESAPLQEQYQQRQNRIDTYKAGAKEKLDIFNQEFSDLANTPWAVYNAIVETEDYRRGSDNSPSALYGRRADVKARAFDSALALV
tara:strand:- start:1700 stop:2746 length:1047 start_codon:yes stop_codon:yes gene_type:complete